MRKDGSLFDARMYVSPLIDPRGQQTGWMTSMTNITEAKRIRDQLSASHERFTTVLEGLDASVSVLSVPQGELLFANRSYRLWFGADAGGHALLTGDADAVGLRARRRGSRAMAWPACRSRTSPNRAPTRARSSSRSCRNGSTCARATCNGPTAAWRRCSSPPTSPHGCAPRNRPRSRPSVPR